MTDPRDMLDEWQKLAESAKPFRRWGGVDPAMVGMLASDLLALLTAVENVLKLHREFRIYDECECVDPGPEGHVEVHEVGRTCNHIYSICHECCTDGGYQREDCANYHVHTTDDWPCATVTAIRDALGGDR